MSFKKYTLKLIDIPTILHISQIIMQLTYFVSFALYMVVVLKKPLKLGTTLKKRLFMWVLVINSNYKGQRSDRIPQSRNRILMYLYVYSRRESPSCR